MRFDGGGGGGGDVCVITDWLKEGWKGQWVKGERTGNWVNYVLLNDRKEQPYIFI